MSTNTIKVQIKDVSSNQNWASDPGMIEIEISAEFLQIAEKCVAFMAESGINYMGKWWAFDYTLYKIGEDLADDETDGKQVLIGKDGEEYIEFTPEYRLEGCNAKIFKDGDIRAVMPFKNSDSGEELWCDVGNIKDLMAMLNSESAEEDLRPAIESPRG